MAPTAQLSCCRSLCGVKSLARRILCASSRAPKNTERTQKLQKTQTNKTLHDAQLFTPLVSTSLHATSLRGIVGRRFFASSPTATKRKSHKPQTIKTLDPTRLSRDDFVDLSHRKKVSLYSENPRSQLLIRFRQRLGSSAPHPFPEGTQGFLYCVPPPHPSLQFASEIRFRITRGQDPSLFAEGQDLRTSDFVPWCIPLASVARFPMYSGLRHLLLQDGFTNHSILERLGALIGNRNLYHASHLVHCFGQPLAFDFTKTNEGLCCLQSISADAFHQLSILRLFRDNRKNLGKWGEAPYAGSALVCLERSPLPAHIGTRTMVLRVQKIISPIRTRIPDYDGHLPKPVEGELVMKRANGGSIEPWSLDIDAKGLTGLQGWFRDSEKLWTAQRKTSTN